MGEVNMSFCKANLFIMGTVFMIDLVFVIIGFLSPHLVSSVFMLLFLTFLVVCIYVFVSSAICFILKLFGHFVSDEKFFVQNTVCFASSILLFPLNFWMLNCLIGYLF